MFRVGICKKNDASFYAISKYIKYLLLHKQRQEMYRCRRYLKGKLMACCSYALYWQNLPKTCYLVNLRTIREAMGNANKIFYAMKGAPYVVYLYSHLKLFDNIKTSGCKSQKRCHATSGKLRPLYCAVGGCLIKFNICK